MNVILLLSISFSTFDFALIPYSGIQTLGKDILFLNHFYSSRILYRPLIEEDSLRKINISGGFTDYFIDINTTYFTFSYKNYSVGIFSFNTGKVEVVDSFGFKTGEVVTPSHIGFVFNIPFLPFKSSFDIKKGLSIKILYVKLKDFSSLAFAFDMSFLKEFIYKEIPIRTSLDIRNIGFQTNKNASLPPYEFSLSISPDLNQIKPALGLSFEEALVSYRISSLFQVNRFLSLLVNFDSRRKETVEMEGLHRVLTGFGAGFILNVKRLSLSYSFVPSGIFQDLHKVDISINF